MGPRQWSTQSGHALGILFRRSTQPGRALWYHSLKNLTSLRSAVAQNIADEKKQQSQSVAPSAKASAAGV